MSGRIVYLDSSCVAKRYVEEAASPLIDTVYARAEMGELVVSFSVWNIGEVFGVFDRYHQHNLMTDSQFQSTLSNFAAETTKISQLGFLNMLPISEPQFLESWKLLIRYHVYVADALQIAAAKESECQAFLTADRKLAKVASSEGLEAASVEEEMARTEKILSKL